MAYVRGKAPVNSAQPLRPEMPYSSPNLRLTDLCNVNAVAVGLSRCPAFGRFDVHADARARPMPRIDARRARQHRERTHRRSTASSAAPGTLCSAYSTEHAAAPATHTSADAMRAERPERRPHERSFHFLQRSPP